MYWLDGRCSSVDARLMLASWAQLTLPSDSEATAATRADLSALRNHRICQMCEISTRYASADVRLSGSNSLVHRRLVYIHFRPYLGPSLSLCTPGRSEFSGRHGSLQYEKGLSSF